MRGKNKENAVFGSIEKKRIATDKNNSTGERGREKREGGRERGGEREMERERERCDKLLTASLATLVLGELTR